MGRSRRPKQGAVLRGKKDRQKARIGKNMLSLSFLILPSLAAASILPIKFDFGDSAKSRPSLRSVQQCEGHENDALVLISGTTPDEICMPGNTVINMHTLIREDLPTDLTLNLDLHKITPFPMTVPCLNGVGSCEYELCPMIEDMADTVCPSFPENQPCGCPLLMGEMHLEGIEMPVQDMGPILGEVMKGSYRATATLYGASNKDKILGCIEFTFKLDTC